MSEIILLSLVLPKIVNNLQIANTVFHVVIAQNKNHIYCTASVIASYRLVSLVIFSCEKYGKFHVKMMVSYSSYFFLQLDD